MDVTVRPVDQLIWMITCFLVPLTVCPIFQLICITELDDISVTNYIDNPKLFLN